MTVYFASDLHYDARRGREATEALAAWLTEATTADDLVVLGGDLGSDLEAITTCLALFADLPARGFAVAGNHDIWVDGEASSQDRYRRVMDLFDEHGFHPLDRQPALVDGLGLVGALGWYDYSFRVPQLEIPDEVYRDKRLPDYDQPVWKDAYHANWGASDPEVTDWQLDRLGEHLGDLDEADEILAVTHHVPTESLLRPQFLPDWLPRRLLVPHKWLVLNTYLGSQRFADLLGEYADRIELALCGHIHLGRRTVEHGITFASNGSDYTSKEVLIYDPPRLRRKTFG